MSLRSSLSLLRAALPLLALVAAAGAGAQTITLDVNSKAAVLVNKNDCALDLTANWTASVGGTTPCADLVIWVTKNATCDNQPGTGDQAVGTVTQANWVSQGSGSFTFPVSGLPVFAGAACPVADLELDMKVCAHAGYSSVLGGACTDLKAGSPPTITYDSKKPGAPTITSVVAQDAALLINFTAPSDASTVTVAYEDAVGPYTVGPTGPSSAGSIRLDGLVNGTTYAVILYAEDAAGNRSDASNALSGTPVQSFGFFATYQNDGGATTGCAAAPAGACPLLALGWLARRRRQARGGARA